MFVERLASTEAAVSVFTLLELCGAASFRLPPAELEGWMFRFTAVYPVRVLDAFGLPGQDAAAWLGAFTDEVAGYLSRRMTLGDALLLREAEGYDVEAVVTWNTKDFHHRTRLRVLTPSAFLRAR